MWSCVPAEGRKLISRWGREGRKNRGERSKQLNREGQHRGPLSTEKWRDRQRPRFLSPSARFLVKLTLLYPSSKVTLFAQTGFDGFCYFFHPNAPFSRHLSQSKASILQISIISIMITAIVPIALIMCLTHLHLSTLAQLSCDRRAL